MEGLGWSPVYPDSKSGAGWTKISCAADVEREVCLGHMCLEQENGGSCLEERGRDADEDVWSAWTNDKRLLEHHAALGLGSWLAGHPILGSDFG